MSLSVNVHSENGRMVITLAGAADAAMLEPLHGPITAALADAQVLVLDLDDLHPVDSTALRDLVTAVLADARGGQLRIAASHEVTISSLTEARIHHLVGVHRSVPDALFGSSDAGRR